MQAQRPLINDNEIRLLQDALATLADGFSELPDFEYDLEWDEVVRV